MKPPPHAFLPTATPGRPAPLGDAVAARVVEVPPYDPAQHVPPTPLMPTLSITPKGVLHLHSSLFRRLGLRYGQPINLVTPIYKNPYWHLDLRPTAPRRVECYDDTRARARGIDLPPGLVTTTLTLHLLPGEPEYAGYYPLLPENAFTTQSP
jgi:hypothetical protein